MKIKVLQKQMIYSEAQAYCERHPEYRLPNTEEAMIVNEVATTEDNIPNQFWISDKLGDFIVEYNSQIMTFNTSHILFKSGVVVIKSEG